MRNELAKGLAPGRASSQCLAHPTEKNLTRVHSRLTQQSSNQPLLPLTMYLLPPPSLGCAERETNACPLPSQEGQALPRFPCNSSRAPPRAPCCPLSPSESPCDSQLASLQPPSCPVTPPRYPYDSSRAPLRASSSPHMPPRWHREATQPPPEALAPPRWLP